MKRSRFSEEQIIGVLMSAGSKEAGGHGQSSFARSSPRVLAAVASGLSHRQAGERFGVSAASVSRWRAREREQGDPRPETSDDGQSFAAGNSFSTAPNPPGSLSRRSRTHL